MTNLQRVLIAAVVGVLVSPATGYAQIGKGWLERLSGPGPFSGPTIEFRFLCFGSGKDLRASVDSSFEKDSIGKKLAFPKNSNTYGWFSAAGCHFIKSDEPRLEVGIHYSALNSSDNLLDYSETGFTTSDTEVNLNLFLVTADIRVNRVLDVGASIGRGSFSSDEGVFADFSKTVYQPMRLTTRPLMAFLDHRNAGVLLVQFDATKFKGGFTAEEFGAKAGSFREPGEIIWAWAIKFDLTPFLW